MFWIMLMTVISKKCDHAVYGELYSRKLNILLGCYYECNMQHYEWNDSLTDA